MSLKKKVEEEEEEEREEKEEEEGEEEEGAGHDEFSLSWETLLMVTVMRIIECMHIQWQGEKARFTTPTGSRKV